MSHICQCIRPSISSASESIRSNCDRWLLSPLKKRCPLTRPRNRAEMQKSCLHNTEKTLFLFLLVFPMSYFYTYLGSGSKAGLGTTSVPNGGHVCLFLGAG